MCDNLKFEIPICNVCETEPAISSLICIVFLTSWLGEKYWYYPVIPYNKKQYFCENCVMFLNCRKVSNSSEILVLEKEFPIDINDKIKNLSPVFFHDPHGDIFDREKYTEIYLNLNLPYLSFQVQTILNKNQHITILSSDATLTSIRKKTKYIFNHVRYITIDDTSEDSESDISCNDNEEIPFTYPNIPPALLPPCQELDNIEFKSVLSSKHNESDSEQNFEPKVPQNSINRHELTSSTGIFGNGDESAGTIQMTFEYYSGPVGYLGEGDVAAGFPDINSSEYEYEPERGEELH